MSHTHHHSHAALRSGAEPSPEDQARQRRAVRQLMIVLIPLAAWTLVGLIVMWPGNISEHIRPDSAFAVEGMTVEKADVTAVTEISCDGVTGSAGAGSEGQVCADATVQLTSGAETGQQVQVTLTAPVYASGVQTGQTVTLYRVPIPESPPAYQFADFERTVPMVVLGLVFAGLVVAVARWRGLASLLGLGFAGFILVKFMFPALVAGGNPILIGLVGGSAILYVVLYAAHGFSARTSTALVGTLFGLFLAALLGWFATKWAHLTGVGSEDDVLLASSAPDLQLTSVVICGVIVAGIGVLNDVTITQASAVWELAESDTDQRRLFSRAMRIGRDHIASTVYTIAFATTGAALATYLLIAVNNRPFLEVIRSEDFAAELISTLVGAIALVLAVPLTTAVGVAVVSAAGSGRKELAPADGRRPERGPADELVDVDPAARGLRGREDRRN